MATSTTSPPLRILFFTQPEHGQANIHIATSAALLRHPNISIHVASFASLRKRVEPLASHQAAAPGSSLTYHTLAGKSVVDCLRSCNKHVSDVYYGAGFWEALRAYSHLGEILAAWTGEEYVGIERECERVINEVQPHLTVVDVLFSFGLDAVRKLGVRYAVLNPCHAKTFAVSTSLGVFYKWPAVASGFPYPLPWYTVPANILLMLYLISRLIFSPNISDTTAARKAANLPGTWPGLDAYSPSPAVQHIVTSIPQIEYPLSVPSNVHSVGPINLTSAPLEESDPKLLRWLSRAPTVLIALGSHLAYDAERCNETAGAIRILLAKHPRTQVLWKIMPENHVHGSELITGNPQHKVILADAIAADQVRVVRWLDADPLAILRTGHVCCFVNHGGGNSFNEGLSTGVSMVILPVWYDLFEYAVKVEWLGVGVWGNRTKAPSVGAEELGDALVKVVGSDEMRNKVKEVQGWVKGAGEGRDKAADLLLQCAREGMVEQAKTS